VDHSGSGESVDGFRNAFLDMVRLVYGANSPKAKTLEEVPMQLINVIDEIRKKGGGKDTKDPRTVTVAKKFYLNGKGVVNKLVGDKGDHARLTPEYPPSKWAIPAKNCWVGNEEAQANELRKQIQDYVKKNGGQITRESVSSGSSSGKPPRKKWLLAFLKYAAHT
jgi:hypothetical protein